LQKTKTLLWEEITTGLTSMLRAVVLTSALKFEDIVLMMRSLKTMLHVGEDFCNSSSTVLRSCIEGKMAEYFVHFHQESFQIVRTMMEVESWDNMFLSCCAPSTAMLQSHRKQQQQPQQQQQQEFTDVSSLFKGYFLRDSISLSMPTLSLFATRSRSAHDLTELASTDGDSDETSDRLRTALTTLFAAPTVGQSQTNESTGTTNTATFATSTTTATIFAQFAHNGNPLRFLVENAIDKFQSFSESVNLLVDQQRVAEPIRQYLRANASAAANSNKATVTSSFVVTQSLLNGLLKYTIKYLDAMILVPEHAPVLFKTLCDFYEFYMCDLFHTFVGESDREQFFAAQTKMASSAPDAFHEYKVSVATDAVDNCHGRCHWLTMCV
jgi:hypothetical protein